MLPQCAPQTLLKRLIMSRSSLPCRAGSSLERTNTQRPPKFGSSSLALSTPNQNLTPPGRCAARRNTASRTFSQTSHMGVLPYCCRLAKRSSIVNPWVKVCTARAPSRRRAASPGSRAMPMQLFLHVERGPGLSDPATQCAKLKVVTSGCSSSRSQRARRAPYGVPNTTRWLFTPNRPFNNKGEKKRREEIR